MKEEKNYNKNIYEEINHKINSMNKIRNSRIQASKRLYHYSDHWKVIALIMNIIAVTSTIISLIDFPGYSSNMNIFLSSVFSIYTIIIQYYVATLNYNERALRFEYQQLGIENFILELKSILIEQATPDGSTAPSEGHGTNEFRINHIDNTIKEYTSVMQRYQELLTGYENHLDTDYNTRNGLSKGNIKRRILPFIFEQDGSFSLDKIIIVSQYLIIILYVLSYTYIYLIN